MSIVDPKISNFSHTGSVHGQAGLSRGCGGPLPCRGVGAGRVSSDRLPVKNHGCTAPRTLGMNLSHTGRVHNWAASRDYGNLHRSRCAELGCTSKDSIPANRNGQSASGDGGSLQPHNDGGGCVSGIQKIPACFPHVCVRSVPESQA